MARLTEEQFYNLTPQQAFDHIVRHLAEQKYASKDKEGRCRYRGPNGLMCAAGALLPDSLYSPIQEGWAVELVTAFDKVPFETIPIIMDCQFVHDSATVYSASGWKSMLFGVALKHNLSIEVLNLMDSALPLERE